MKLIDEIQQEIISDFNLFSDWTQKYEYLIDLGKELKVLDAKYKTEENLIKGCQSNVWLIAKKEKNNIAFTADSDAIMTKGIIALLIKILSNQTAKDITNCDLFFIKKIGLSEHLSATRANGLLSMIKQMKLYAYGLENK
mgnify:FL=1|tara:strand:- start:103 stop:522 length:420 start_codon:yes stop_codon:yes gene_type:complete